QSARCLAVAEAHPTLTPGNLAACYCRTDKPRRRSVHRFAPVLSPAPRSLVFPFLLLRTRALLLLRSRTPAPAPAADLLLSPNARSLHAAHRKRPGSGPGNKGR